MKKIEIKGDERNEFEPLLEASGNAAFAFMSNEKTKIL